MRAAYGSALVELGRVRDDVVVLSADVSNSDYSYQFGDAYPDRFLNVGIAEPCLVDVAVGIALEGRVAFANSFAFLLATRALEAIRTHCCYGEVPVKLIGAYAGVSDSFDGPTHHAISDVAIMRSLPGMAIVSPADPVAVERLLSQVADWPGPVYMRLNRNEVPILFGDDYQPEMGQAIEHRPGNDVTLVGSGILLGMCLEASESLAGEGIDARVVEVHTIKPLDETMLLKAARETGAIVTAEEHSIVGGLGGAVAELLVERHPVPIERVGLRDSFATSGPYLALLHHLGLTAESVAQAARRALQRKRAGS